MIPGMGAFIRLLKLLASMVARDLAQSDELVGVGHRFGKVRFLTLM